MFTLLLENTSMLFTENSTFGELSSGQIAAISGLLIGIGLRIVEKFLNKGKDNLEEHVALRKELREELDTVKEELYGLRKEVDEWREKYYDQLTITTQLQSQIERLTNEIESYKRISGLHKDESPDVTHNGWFDLPPEE